MTSPQLTGAQTSQDGTGHLAMETKVLSPTLQTITRLQAITVYPWW